MAIGYDYLKELTEMSGIAELARVSREISDMTRYARLSGVMAEFEEISRRQAEMVRAIAVPTANILALQEQIAAAVALPRISLETNHALLASLAESSNAIRESATFKSFASAQRLMSLIPSTPDWSERVEKMIGDVARPQVRRVSLSPAATEAILQRLTPFVDAVVAPEDDSSIEDRDEMAPVLFAELVEVVDSATPALRDELAIAETEDDRLRAFVRGWCQLPPVVQFVLAVLLQWLTIGLAAEYLKEHGMLPGIGSDGDL